MSSASKPLLLQTQLCGQIQSPNSYSAIISPVKFTGKILSNVNLSDNPPNVLYKHSSYKAS